MCEPDAETLRARYLPRLLKELEDLRESSTATAEARRPVELDQQSVGRLSRMDALQQQAMAAAQEARRLAHIRSVEAAIRRLNAGEFGWCDSCGEFIGEKRLGLDPTLMRCIGCAR
ncbi:TraR/DksA family transcriptional regulator [Pannonibacter indicus]|uniref:TraR/DksA family transcriptional regulator n=1 Tax=Pannonibacter indicus TaxID=466044 RepID=UPI00391B67ED